MFEPRENYRARSTTMPAVSRKEDNRVTKSMADEFIGALTELESACEIERMVTLFADDCEVGNAVISYKFHGPEGARKFWTLYRTAFKDVCSIFQNESYSRNQMKLSWITEGKERNGRRIKYGGVSLLETEYGKITRFYAIFDPQRFAGAGD